MRSKVTETLALSVKEVLANLCQCEVKVNDPEPKDLSKTTEEITILLRISGKIQGKVFYMMNKKFGLELASNMIGMPINEVDELGISALSEIGNIITGNAMTKLSEIGYYCEATTPQIIIGVEQPVKSLDPLGMVMKSETPIGDLYIGIITSEY